MSLVNHHRGGPTLNTGKWIHHHIFRTVLTVSRALYSHTCGVHSLPEQATTAQPRHRVLYPLNTPSNYVDPEHGTRTYPRVEKVK